MWNHNLSSEAERPTEETSMPQRLAAATGSRAGALLNRFSRRVNTV
jgi:hypothetical protein